MGQLSAPRLKTGVSPPCHPSRQRGLSSYGYKRPSSGSSLSLHPLRSASSPYGPRPSRATRTSSQSHEPGRLKGSEKIRDWTTHEAHIARSPHTTDSAPPPPGTSPEETQECASALGRPGAIWQLDNNAATVTEHFPFEGLLLSRGPRAHGRPAGVPPPRYLPLVREPARLLYV